MNQEFLNSDYMVALVTVVALVFFMILYMLVRAKQELKTKNKRIEEQEEKIQYLRQIGAENESKRVTLAHETEKEILALKHTIEGLEVQIKEGTKNQVVSALKAQQNKRAKALKRAGLTDQV